METIVYAISDSSESAKINVTNVTPLVLDVLDLTKINAQCALMSAILLRKVLMDADIVLEITHALLVSTTIKVTVNHAHHIVPNVNQKMYVNHVFLDSNSIKWNTIILSILTALKSVVMVRDSNLTAMMVTRKMAMVATATVKFKKDGTVKVDLVREHQLVFNMLHQDVS